MAPGIRIQSNWRPALNAVEQELFRNPAPLLKVWGLRTLREVNEIFRAGGKPAWAPLRPSTLAAKRQGKGTGGAKALAGLRASFDMALTGPREVTVFSTDPKALFHEYGTGTHGKRGTKYPIVPKNAKALALPFLPGVSEGKGTAGTGKAGRFSLSGLGRSRANARGSFTTFGGKTKVAYTNVSFRKKVMHPGVAVRRMLPTPEQLTPILKREAAAFIAHLMQRRTNAG